jgi:hypothetical protein
VNHSSESNISETACDSYTAPDGQVYTSSGLKTAVIPNAAGCDSTITIDLVVNHTTESSITETACNSFDWNGTTYNTSGNYAFTTINAAGCDSTANLHLTINSTPATPVISQAGAVLHSDAPEGNQWYAHEGLINGATEQDYEVTEINSYFVIVTLFNCSSQPSNTIQVITTGIGLSDKVHSVKVYPNPVINEFTIETEGNKERFSFEILNISGQVVYEGNFIEKTTILSSEFLPGVYLIKLGNGKDFEFIKILIE